MHRRSLSAALLVALLGAAGPVAAEGVATTDGAFARVGRERAVVVWDAGKRTQHLFLKLEIDTDAREVGLLVPLPSRPRVGPGDDALIERAAELLGSKKESDPALRFDEQGTEVLESASAVSAWLAAHAFVDRPALLAWAEAELARGEKLVALRYVAPPPPPPPPGVTIVRGEGAKARKLALGPSVRLSFATDTVFFPYSEPAGDIAAEAAYVAKYGEGEHPRLAPRPLDVWLLSDTPRRAKGTSLPLENAATVKRDAVAGLLGDTSAWPFDPAERASFTLLHFAEALSPARLAFDDLELEPFTLSDLREARGEPGPVPPRESSPLPLILAALGGAALATAIGVGVGVARRRRR